MTTAKLDLIFASLPYNSARVPDPVYNAIQERDADCSNVSRRQASCSIMVTTIPVFLMKYLAWIRILHQHWCFGIGSQWQHQAEERRRCQKAHGTFRHLDRRDRAAADLVVYAIIGYGSMNGFAANLISREVADKVGKVWGLGSNTTKTGPMGRRTAKYVEADTAEGLWFHGGNLHQSRHYSQFLSLAVEGANGRRSHAGLQSPEGPPSELIACSIALSKSGDGCPLRVSGLSNRLWTATNALWLFVCRAYFGRSGDLCSRGAAYSRKLRIFRGKRP